MKCMLCKNIFFILDMPMRLNDPDFCPYCGCEFELEIDTDLDPYQGLVLDPMYSNSIVQ